MPAMKMPFGKYKDWAVGDLPPDYVAWLLGLEDLATKWPFLHKALVDEHARRTCPDPTSEMVKSIIDAGYRALALKYHPDKGGSTTQMQDLNNSVEWLRVQIRARGM